VFGKPCNDWYLSTFRGFRNRIALFESSRTSLTYTCNNMSIKLKMSMEHRWNDTDRGKLKTRRKTCPSATLSTTNPTWTDPESNLGLRGEATNKFWKLVAIKNWVTTSQTTQDASITKNNRLFLYNEITGICCKNLTKDSEFHNVASVGIKLPLGFKWYIIRHILLSFLVELPLVATSSHLSYN
jgi:hypothetical protein